MAAKKLLCVLLSVFMLVSLFTVLAGAKTVIELTEEELEFGKTLDDWYDTLEPLTRLKTARARILNPEGWEAIADELIYASNGQLAARQENIDLIMNYWDATRDKEDPSVILGDIDGSGSLTVGDARLALRIAVGLDELTETITLNMVDLSLNDNADITDARLILREAIGLGASGVGFDLSFAI